MLLEVGGSKAMGETTQATLYRFVIDMASPE
jgi:hypothetical protein